MSLELTKEHDNSNSNTSVVTSQIQQKKRQVISRNDVSTSLEFIERLKDSNFNTSIMTSQVRHEKGPVILHYNPLELIKELEDLNSDIQEIDFVLEGFMIF